MKELAKKYDMKEIFTMLLIFCALNPGFSQNQITLSGTILDKETSAPLAFASIGLTGRSIGTISNEQGEFEFHFLESCSDDSLFVSMLGYESHKEAVNRMPPQVVILLAQKPILLPGVVVTSRDLEPEEIVKRAIASIMVNYQLQPYMMEGFFRQIQKVDTERISILEAAVNILDPGYGSKKKEKLEIVEIRKSHYSNTKKFLNHADTFYTQKHNSLKSTLEVNRVRKLASSNKISESFYPGKFLYQMDTMLYYDDRTVYVISAIHKANKGYLKDRGKENRINTILVDAETFAIIKVLFQYSPRGQYDPEEFRNVTKTNDSILSVVRGHTHIYEFSRFEDLQYLKYVRWSDWVQDYNLKSQKVLHTNEYQHELLINRIETDPIHFTEVKETMDSETSLHLQLKDYNASFWRNYNILFENVPKATCR